MFLGKDSTSLRIRSCRKSLSLQPPSQEDNQQSVVDGFSTFCSALRSSMDRSSFKHFTQKTFFLVAWAVAKRVNELQALPSQVARQDNNMVLSYLPEFIAKTETSSHPLPREFTFTSLTAMVGADDEERLLCPVRALC